MNEVSESSNEIFGLDPPSCSFVSWIVIGKVCHCSASVGQVRRPTRKLTAAAACLRSPLEGLLPFRDELACKFFLLISPFDQFSLLSESDSSYSAAQH
ncbi:hypothetical protein M408DRAFT_326026 [Serendipita vermifera MAFF 305830]|uniref:Uncharacterized protein n=1 Tax=Serendipita vermifera MAFF 305830 TaxID=933852 RepID=A0A0C2X548_SERVB|nr:hypothetical protein M408DRAFT_326026 [Serendipita vermifera MAFF 305830]